MLGINLGNAAQFRQYSVMSLKTGRLPAVLLLLYGPASVSDAAAPPERIVSPAALANWQERSFSGHTQYRATADGTGQALHAIAVGTASGLCQAVQIDLNMLPVVHWRWRLDRAPGSRDERGREGDDQGLRISFLYQSVMSDESILAVQYVWSQSEPAGTGWSNPYVADAYELVARSGPAAPGEWHTEQRDLSADFRTAFGRAVDRIDAICLMTDGDQTGALVEGWYGDITLQAR